jgi:DNA-binding transcriptional regulator YhcF (GntR family)
MLKKLGLTVVLVIAVASTGLIFAVRTDVAEATLGDHGPGHRFGDSLTEEQREAIHDMVVEMREAGASRQEIREAVAEMLRRYGVEVPERGLPHRGPGHRFGASLTEEQREAIHDMVVEMREAGASREEIREAVAEMLRRYGVEPPPLSGDSGGEPAPLSSEDEGSATWGGVKRRFR